MVSYAEVKSYLSKREIPQLFESLMAGLMYHRPENHIHYLQSCLDELKSSGDTKVQWSMFVNNKKRKSKEMLPPLTPKKQESVSWSSDSRQSTPLPPISARSRALRSQSMPCNGETLRNTYILYHNPPPVLTPPTVPVIFVIGGLGPKIDNLCEEVVSKLRGLVHISASSMLKTRMIIEGFYRMTSIPACAVVDSVLQAMSMVKSAKALIVAGFPRNRGDIEEYKSRRVRVDAAVLVDFEESALRNLLVTEVASGLIKTSEIDYELDKCKQDLISVAEYYDEKELLTVVMGDQNTEDVVGDLVIAIERVLEYGTRFEDGKHSEITTDLHPSTDEKTSIGEHATQTLEEKAVEANAEEAAGDERLSEPNLSKKKETIIDASEDDMCSTEIIHEVNGDIVDSDDIQLFQNQEELIESLPPKNGDESLINSQDDKVETMSKHSDVETKDESQSEGGRDAVELSLNDVESNPATEGENIADAKSAEVKVDSQIEEEEDAESTPIEVEEEPIIKQTIEIRDLDKREFSSPVAVNVLVSLTGSANPEANENGINSEYEETEVDSTSLAKEASHHTTTSEQEGQQDIEEHVDISAEEKEAASQEDESELPSSSQPNEADEFDSQQRISIEDNEDNQEEKAKDTEENEGSQKKETIDTQSSEGNKDDEEGKAVDTEESEETKNYEEEKAVDVENNGENEDEEEVKAIDTGNDERKDDVSVKPNAQEENTNDVDVEASEDVELKNVTENGSPVPTNENDTEKSEESRKSEIDEGVEQVASPSDYGTMDEAKDDEKFIADFDSMEMQNADMAGDSSKNLKEDNVVQDDSQPNCILDDDFDENSAVPIDIKVTQPLPDPSEASTATASPVSMETALLLPKKTDQNPKPLPIVFTLTGIRIQKTTLRNMLANSGINLVSFEDITKAHFHPMDFDQALHLLKSTMLWERTLGSKLFLVTEFPWQLMGHENIDEIANLGDVSFITDDGPKNTGPESEEEEPSVENDAKTICDSMLSVYFKNQLKTISRSGDTSEELFQTLQNLINDKEQTADYNTRSIELCTIEPDGTDNDETEPKEEEGDDPDSVNQETVVNVPSDAIANEVDKSDEIIDDRTITIASEHAEDIPFVEGSDIQNGTENVENTSHEISEHSHHDDSTSQILSEGDHGLEHDDEEPSVSDGEKNTPSFLVRQGTFCATEKDEDSVNLDLLAEINQNLLDVTMSSKPDTKENETADGRDEKEDMGEPKILGSVEVVDEVLSSEEATTFKSIPSLQKDDNNVEAELVTVPDSEIVVKLNETVNLDNEKSAEHSETLLDSAVEEIASVDETREEEASGDEVKKEASNSEVREELIADDEKEEIPDGEDDKVNHESSVLDKTLKTPDEDYDENDDSENSECKFDTDQSENDAVDMADQPKTETDKYLSTSSENNLNETRVLEVTAEVYAVNSADFNLDTILSNKDTKTSDQEADELHSTEHLSDQTDVNGGNEGETPDENEGKHCNGTEEQVKTVSVDEDDTSVLAHPAEVIDELILSDNLDEKNDKRNSISKLETEKKSGKTNTDDDKVASENAKNEKSSQLIELSNTEAIHKTEQTNGHLSAKSRESGGETVQDENDDNEERERSTSSSRGEL